MSAGLSRRDLFRGLFGRKPTPPHRGPTVREGPPREGPPREGPGAESLAGPSLTVGPRTEVVSVGPRTEVVSVGTRKEVVGTRKEVVGTRKEVVGTRKEVAPRFGRGVPLPVLRPPGAIEEAVFLATCTRCNACLEACPHEAITLAPARLREAAGTPILQPADSPCRMCADRPCITVCEPQALRFDLPAKMGTAVISPLACLAHQNSTCSACVEQCPVEGAIRWENSRPVVNPDLCTGCGVCQYVCPAPQNAVMILPTKSRPLPPLQEVPHDHASSC